MFRTPAPPALAMILIAALTTATTHAQPTLPPFDPADFDASSSSLTNPYFPLAAGKIYNYEVENTDPDTGEVETEQILLEVLHATRTIAGVEARVVRDRVYSEGLIREDTFDWFAQDITGNVWYMGEDVTDYHYDDDDNLLGTSHPGQWEAGVNGASPGYIMPANPMVGHHYYEEFLIGEAVDEAEIIGINEMKTVPFGTFDSVVHTRNSTALEPESLEQKFYAPGVGTILAYDIDFDSGEIVGYERLISVVPEPSSAALTLAGLITMFTHRRRK